MEIYLTKKKGAFQIMDTNDNVIKVDKNDYHIINKNIFSEKNRLFYVQCEVLVGVNSSIRVETKEEAQVYALELVKEKKNQ